MSSSSSVRATSVGDLLTVLGSTGLTLASSAVGRDLAIARTALFDRLSDLDETKAGILLVPGTSAGDPDAAAIVESAALRAFNAVVLKAHGDDTGSLALTADKAGVALLLLHDDVDWLHLDSLLHNALATASPVGGGSLSSDAVGDLFTLAGAIADAVGGATTIEDHSRRVLAYSSIPSQPIDDDRREGILGRKVPDLPENDQQYLALHQATAPLRFEATPPSLPRLAVAVRAGQEVLGSIWVVDPHGRLDEAAEQALLGAAPTVALHLLRARSAEELARRERSDLVRRLLEGVARPRQAAEALGLDPAGPFAVLGFAPEGPAADAPDLGGIRLLDLVTLYCEARVGAIGAALLDGTTYVLAGGSRIGGEQALNRLAGEVVGVASGSPQQQLVAAVSTTVDDLDRLGEAREEVDRIVSLLRRRSGLGRVASARSLADQLSLAAVARAVTTDRRLLSRTAEAIVDHDRQEGTSYGVYVLAYLDSLRDVGAAAGRLAMHPNTLRYRLRRARELFGVDLDDPDHVLALWLSLRSLDGEGPPVSPGGPAPARSSVRRSRRSPGRDRHRRPG